MAEPSITKSLIPSLYLVPVAGPDLRPLQLIARDDHAWCLTLGRHESCELALPSQAESVSRFHARFRWDPDSAQWRVVDLGSKWGTHINGVRLVPHVELPLVAGDLVRIEPWAFSVSAALGTRGLMLNDDVGQSVVNTLAGAESPQLALREDMLALLLEAAAAIHDATTENELVTRLLDAAVAGSGLPNGAVLRPLDANGRFEVLATRSPAALDSSRFTFSRSLLNAAAGGLTSELSQIADVSESIAQMNIAAALCVPLLVGGTPAAFLYMDRRNTRGALARALRPNASEFCTALGRFAGLALANLRRIDVERRQAVIEHDLRAAAVAQKWVLPPRETVIGPITVTGESRPGRYVGGDFFDVIALGGGLVAIALGDVCGKGIEASVLMTATQGFLHASLLHHRNVGAAVTAINHFICPRRPDSRFVTLWVGMIDTAAREITYVDAGHGYAVLVGHDGNIRQLNDGGGPPLGLTHDCVYSTEVVALPAQGRLVVVSDGVVEQPSRVGVSATSRDEFQMKGVIECAAASSGDDIAELFRRLVEHAGTSQLADDATAVCARWNLDLDSVQ